MGVITTKHEALSRENGASRVLRAGRDSNRPLLRAALRNHSSQWCSTSTWYVMTRGTSATPLRSPRVTFSCTVPTPPDTGSDAGRRRGRERGRAGAPRALMRARCVPPSLAPRPSRMAGQGALDNSCGATPGTSARHDLGRPAPLARHLDRQRGRGMLNLQEERTPPVQQWQETLLVPG